MNNKQRQRIRYDEIASHKSDTEIERPHLDITKQGEHKGITYKEISKTGDITTFALYKGDNEIGEILVESNTFVTEAIDRAISRSKEEPQSEIEPPQVKLGDHISNTLKGKEKRQLGETTQEILLKYESMIDSEKKVLDSICILEKNKARYGVLETPVSLELQLSEYKEKLETLRVELRFLENQLKKEKEELATREKQKITDIERRMRQTRIKHLEIEIGHKKELVKIYQFNIRLIEIWKAKNPNELSIKVENEYLLTCTLLEKAQKELKTIRKERKSLEQKYDFPELTILRPLSRDFEVFRNMQMSGQI